VFPLDLAGTHLHDLSHEAALAHIHDLHREAALAHMRAAAPANQSRLRRLVTRARSTH
jgi:hypothetical protein